MIVLSVRPTKTWILGACEKTFQKSYKDMCGSFAQRFSELASFCHRKKLRMKTGERMSPALRRLVKAISKECDTNTQGLGEKFFHAKKRTLEKTHCINTFSQKEKEGSNTFGFIFTS